MGFQSIHGIQNCTWFLTADAASAARQDWSLILRSPPEPPSLQGMTRRTFHFSEGTSNKFWSIEVTGTKTLVHFGRVGLRR